MENIEKLLSSMSPREKARRAFAPYVDESRWVAWNNENGRKIPINPWDRHKGKASSTNETTWGPRDQAIASMKRFGLSGIGFVLKEDDCIVGIDIDDCRNPTTGNLTKWAQSIVNRLGSYCEVSPSGTGVKIWGIWDDDGKCGLTRSYKDNAIGLEIYPHSRYFTVTGRAIGGDEIVDISDALSDIIEENFAGRDEYVERSRVGGAGDLFDNSDGLDLSEWVEAALEYIDPDEGYDTWLSVGMALHNGFDGASVGLSIWDQWSQRSVDYNAKEIDQKWSSFGGDGITPGTIWRWASDNGWSYDPGVDEWGAVPTWGENIQVDDDVRSAREGLQKLQWLDAASLYEDRRPYEPHLVEPQIIGKSDVAMIFGPPKSMKTMVCMDMCRQWAAGKPWMDLTVHRPLRIAYLNFEIKKDNLRRRLHTVDLDDDHIKAMRGNLWITNRFVDTLSATFMHDCLETLAAQTAAMKEGQGWDLIVIDPLIDLFNGENENDNKQVKDFINGLKKLAHYIDPDSALLLVHHANKVKRNERHTEPFNALRGGSAFRGSYDTGISLDWEDESRDVLRLAFECRNGPGPENRKVTYNSETGRFDFVDDMTTERVAGEEMGTKWDREAVRRADLICDIIQEEALKGNLYTQTAFADRFGSIERYGLGGKTTLKQKIKELLVKQVLGVFDASKYGGPAPYGRSEGHLCCLDMVVPDGCTDIDTAVGVVKHVEPDYVFDVTMDDLVPGNVLVSVEDAHQL